MYHAIVRDRIRRRFEGLEPGDWTVVVDSAADDIRHVFPGNHALGGERRSRAAFEQWIERLERLCPMRLEVLRVASRGWPWNTWVAVEWIAHVSPRAGEQYDNEGTTWLRLRFGKVAEIHEYLDTQRVVDACREMAARGIEEALADPVA